MDNIRYDCGVLMRYSTTITYAWLPRNVLYSGQSSDCIFHLADLRLGSRCSRFASSARWVRRQKDQPRPPWRRDKPS